MIFDCDGTLVDFELLVGRAWKVIVALYGYEVIDVDFEVCMGIFYVCIYVYLF